MNTEREITVIPATAPRFSAQWQGTVTKRRVAAYARVSTEKEEQQTSYKAQVEYYTDRIKINPEWFFVEVYADADRSYGLNPKRP